MRLTVGVGAAALAAIVSIPGASQASTTVNSDGATSLSTARSMTTVEVGLQPQHMALTPDGSRLYVTNRVSNSVSVVDTITGTLRASIAVSPAPRDIVVSPDGKYVYVSHDFTDSISVIATASNVVVRTIPVASPGGSMAIAPDGLTLYAIQGIPRTLVEVDTQTGAIKAALPAGTTPVSVTLSADGRTLYAIDSPCTFDECEPATVRVIDTGTNTVTHELTIGASGETAVLSPDGARLYAADLNDIWVFSTVNYELLGKVRTFVTSSLSISNDGQVLYATRYDKPSLVSIDTARFAIFDRAPLPTRPNDSALSPDGTTLYVLSQISGPELNPDPGVVIALDPPALVNIQATCARAGSKKAPAVRCTGTTIGVPEGTKLAITYRNPPSMEWRTIPESMTPVVSTDGRFTWTMATGKTKRMTLYFSYGGTKSALSAVKLR